MCKINLGKRILRNGSPCSTRLSISKTVSDNTGREICAGESQTLWELASRVIRKLSTDLSHRNISGH
jgi:hypothetical protein